MHRSFSPSAACRTGWFARPVEAGAATKPSSPRDTEIERALHRGLECHDLAVPMLFGT